MTNLMEQVGVVAIGRNEGERLSRCLLSALAETPRVAYVDSGSTDASVAMARSLGVEVVELDMSIPFTAARARNAGVARLRQVAPELRFVQVVDGDCELIKGWLHKALDVMANSPKAAIVCGRRRERQPGASVYNRLCDMEWDTPVGEAEACGGDALIRIEAFTQAGGYDDSVIAGEEPELCIRLRKLGWQILRIDAEMTLHDAQMRRFSQWWKRMVRAGHAYAQGRAMHGRLDRLSVEQLRSIMNWALIFPALSLGLAWFTYGASLVALIAGYGLLLYRIRRGQLAEGRSPADATLYAQYCLLGKFPQLIGIAQYWINRIFGRQSTIIEYKGAPNLGARS